jgi:cation:H+ antiporter
MRRASVSILLAGGLAAPAVVLRFTGFTESNVAEALIYGIAILGAAFLLGAAAELAELEISASLALALVALIAIMPEYAVDMVFAWKAADDPVYAQYAAANMTGGNRLLVGIGWPAVILLFWWKRGRKPLTLDKGNRLELTFLLLATGWAFTIFLRTLFRDGSLNIVDSVVLVGMFVAYLVISSRGEVKKDVHLVGPMAPFAALQRPARRALIIGLFAVSALVIVASAEPFAEGLIEVGLELGIDQFILVQWVAPLASEAPEIGVAVMFAMRGMGSLAMGVLISSKVNQWTLLVGTLPVVYSISAGSISELPLDTRQADEFLLTAAQSLFAVLLLASMRVSWRGGMALLVLFLSQLFFTDTTVRAGFSILYLGLSLAILIGSRETREGTWALLSGGLRWRAPAK